MISSETHAPIDRTKMSKALIGDPSKLEWRSADVLKIKYNTNLRIGTVSSFLLTVNREKEGTNATSPLPNFIDRYQS